MTLHKCSDVGLQSIISKINKLWDSCYREYLLPRVNTLRNSLKISDTTKKEVFELKFFQIDKEKTTKQLRWRFQQCFGHFNILTLHKRSDAGTSTHLSNHTIILEKNQLWNSHFFSKFDVDFRNLGKNWEKLWVLDIIGLQLIALNTHFYRGRILVLRTPYVIKQSQHFIYY